MEVRYGQKANNSSEVHLLFYYQSAHLKPLKLYLLEGREKDKRRCNGPQDRGKGNTANESGGAKRAFWLVIGVQRPLFAPPLSFAVFPFPLSWGPLHLLLSFSLPSRRYSLRGLR